MGKVDGLSGKVDRAKREVSDQPVSKVPDEVALLKDQGEREQALKDWTM